MQIKKWLIFLACLSTLLVACQKAPVEVSKHPYTEEELVKAHLDESFTKFVNALDLDSTVVKQPEKFILENSSIATNWADRGAIIYRLKRHGRVVLLVRFYVMSGELSASLYGGIAIKGTIVPADLHVYDDDKDVAKLEYDRGLSCLVFRFPDGTGYALNSLLISEALIDFLIENVLSTE